MNARTRKFEFISEYHIEEPNMLISLTVGKVDAGVAVLLTEDKRLVSHLETRSLTSRVAIGTIY